MMGLSRCNYNRIAILPAALIFASLCSFGPTCCLARSTAWSPAAAQMLPPDVGGEVDLLGYGTGMQGSGTAASTPGASLLSAFTSSSPAAANPPCSAGGGGAQRSGDDGRRMALALEKAADLKTARRLLSVGETKASSRPSCTSSFVPCPPPGHV